MKNDISLLKRYKRITDDLLTKGTNKYIPFNQFKDLYDVKTCTINIPEDLKLSSIHIEYPVIQKYLNTYKSARSRHIKFEIPFDEFKSIYVNICFYTGKKLKQQNISIDRVDNNKGYVSGNCVVCNTLLNRRKNDLTIYEIESIYNGIIKHKTSRISSSLIDKFSRFLFHKHIKIVNEFKNVL